MRGCPILLKFPLSTTNYYIYNLQIRAIFVAIFILQQISDLLLPALPTGDCSSLGRLASQKNLQIRAKETLELSRYSARSAPSVKDRLRSSSNMAKAKSIKTRSQEQPNGHALTSKFAKYLDPEVSWDKVCVPMHLGGFRHLLRTHRTITRFRATVRSIMSFRLFFSSLRHLDFSVLHAVG